MTGPELLSAITDVVSYAWDDELRDWLECLDNDNENGILEVLYRLAQFAGMDDHVRQYERLVTPHLQKGKSE
jgi:hypothetical protein